MLIIRHKTLHHIFMLGIPAIMILQGAIIVGIYNILYMRDFYDKRTYPYFHRDAENTGDSRVREKFGVLSGAVGLACNLFLFALKLIIGLLTGSISIAADAFNNLSDGLSCLISIVGFKVSGKEPDAKHPFGYGRTSTSRD